MDLIYKDSFVVDGERYYHYSYGGKWQSTKFVTVHGINRSEEHTSELQSR